MLYRKDSRVCFWGETEKDDFQLLSHSIPYSFHCLSCLFSFIWKEKKNITNDTKAKEPKSSNLIKKILNEKIVWCLKWRRGGGNEWGKNRGNWSVNFTVFTLQVGMLEDSTKKRIFVLSFLGRKDVKIFYLNFSYLS